MKQIRDSYKKTGRMHHAYGILGDREKAKEEIFDFLKKDLKFPILANPDFWSGEFNVFKIADSRALNEAHLNRPVKYAKKIFVIFANFITKDAQNSLLKIFEEPRAEAVFFLAMPENTDLLPTFKSRLILGVIASETKQSSIGLPRSARKDEEGKRPDALEFLSAKIGKRLNIIAKIVKDIKDEKINKSEAIKFIKSLEKEIKSTLKLKNAHNARGGSLLAIEDIEKAISYAGDESPSIKVILEHLALVL